MRIAAMIVALSALPGCAQSQPAAAQPERARPEKECYDLRHHGKMPEARRCFTALARSNDPAVLAEGFWGLGDFKGANDAFRVAVKQRDKDPDIKVRWGRMFLERSQPKDAADSFSEALELKKDHAGALLGLALIAADHFDKKAADFAQQALKSDPKLLEAQELLARIALEDNDPEKAVKEADKAIAMSGEALNAMAIRATIDWMDDKKSTPWIDRILKINPVYGEAYATAGHFFVINRRYEEGIQYYRKALELNPELWDAKSDLGVNLMRLGHDGEAYKLLEEVYNSGYSVEATRNTLKLMDTYKTFATFETPTTILRLSKKESDVLRPYFQAELERAMATYEKKYKYKLSGPVQLEVYPNHEDFAVRTMGMPGLGALGVTFGNVVAMDSPSGRKPGEWHWASTLWHELSHVYVLSMTKHRVPRWFTEGLAVHEETATSPDWGDRLNSEVIKAIQEKKLLPVAELDRGFIHPSYPSQVIVSYFQAGKICDYIHGKWGDDKLLEMIHAFAANEPTPSVIQSKLGMKPEEFDTQFLAWLDAQTHKTVSSFTEWTQRVRQMAKSLNDNKVDDVINEGRAIRDNFPDYVEHNSVYEQLADAYTKKGDKARARQELERYAAVGGRSPSVLKKLATLQEEAGDKRAAAASLEKLNLIYPVDDELHQRLGGLYMDIGNGNGAVREYQAWVSMKPQDQAGAHFALARALNAAGKKEEAKEAVLSALEAAPGFKPAQKLLLELDRKD